MRSTFRSLTFGLAGLLSAGAIAQYPYTIALSGTVANCYPGQMVTVQTVQGTMPQQSFTVNLDSNTCSYSVFVSVSNQPAWLEVTTLCGGMMQVGSDSSQFDFVGDTATSFIDLLCGGGAYDCLQILNGPNLPGTSCDDGNPMTMGDLWTPACVCAGADSSYTEDCSGIPGGQNLPGTFCINFFGDTGMWSVDCICQTNTNTVDCLGNPGGGALPGTACTWTPDNGNTWVTGTWSVDCVCGPDSGGFFNDCLGVVNGPNMPGTACIVPGTILEGTWSSACVCVPDSTGFLYDCNGVLNGPNMPGAPCTTFLGDQGEWSADCACETNTLDCLGILNGPNSTGTTCDDGDSTTINDVWSIACQCEGQIPGYIDCLGIPNGPNVIWTPCVNTIDSVTYMGYWNFGCYCVGDSLNPQFDCMGVLGGNAWPGTPCEDGDPLTTNDTWSFDCACTGIDTSGTYDCLQILNGPNMPGTSCVWNNQPGVWSMACICVPDSGNVFDCLWVLNGPNLPGTACTVPGTTLEGTWSLACVCLPDSTGFLYDCNGVLNGPDMPGMPCDDSNPATTNDTWNSACVCVGNSNEPCNADFWVIQAMGSDSLPVPYELWVWNLSSGGSGNFQFLWNFGDGTSSTDAYPTHTYSGNGPYVLCLTINDDNNCTSTHCDSISINGDGIFEGMPLHDSEDRQDGFTLNVQNATAVQELVADNSIVLWPNPATDELNVAVVSGMNGAVTVMITDLDGRTVKTERMSIAGGRSQLRIATNGLNAGMYLLRVSDGSMNLSQRFVKTN